MTKKPKQNDEKSEVGFVALVIYCPVLDKDMLVKDIEIDAEAPHGCSLNIMTVHIIVNDCPCGQKHTIPV